MRGQAAEIARRIRRRVVLQAIRSSIKDGPHVPPCRAPQKGHPMTGDDTRRPRRLGVPVGHQNGALVRTSARRRLSSHRGRAVDMCGPERAV